MRFELAKSPFVNIHKFHDSDLLSYLDPHVRAYASDFRDKMKKRVSPSAFTFGETQGSLLMGWSFSTPLSFNAAIQYEILHLKAKKVLLLAEVMSFEYA